MKTQLVAFLYSDSADLYLRTDDGNGHFTYRRVPVSVVKGSKSDSPSQLWVAMLSTVNFVAALLGQ